MEQLTEHMTREDAEHLFNEGLLYMMEQDKDVFLSVIHLDKMLAPLVAFVFEKGVAQGRAEK